MGLDDYFEQEEALKTRAKAGDWDYMLCDQFRKIENGQRYNPKMVENALEQLRKFYPVEVYVLYKSRYEETRD